MNFVMKRPLLLLFTIVAALASFTTLSARPRQSPQAALVSIVGDVVALDKVDRTATVKTDQLSTLLVKVSDDTACLRVPAGEKSLANAVVIHFVDIVVGDRVLARGSLSEDRKEFAAQRIVVLTKAEIEKKRQSDLQEWQRRGIAGVVKELNPATQEISIEIRGAGPATRMLISTSGSDFRRYSGTSIRFEDAKPSAFGDLKVGDQLRALGDKGADGHSFKAAEIVSGAFKTIGAVVMEVDLQKSEIKATTLDQKKPILITIAKDSALHRIPQQLAGVIAQRAQTGRTINPAPNPPAANSQRVTGPPQSPDVQQLIDALPNLNLTDIKTGDVIAVTSTIDKDDSSITAIKLVAGVDAVLKAMAPPAGKPQTVRLSAGLPAAFDFSVIQ